MERWLSGRRHVPAKDAYSLKGTEGSNPSLSEKAQNPRHLPTSFLLSVILGQMVGVCAFRKERTKKFWFWEGFEAPNLVRSTVRGRPDEPRRSPAKRANPLFILQTNRR